MFMHPTPLLLLSIKLKLLTAVNGLDIQGLCVPLCVCFYVWLVLVVFFFFFSSIQYVLFFCASVNRGKFR